jgi:hypothetical protein
VTRASIGIETDDYLKHVAHGPNLYAANEHQGVLSAFRVSLRIISTIAPAPGWLGRFCKIGGGTWVGNRSRPIDNRRALLANGACDSGDCAVPELTSS